MTNPRLRWWCLASLSVHATLLTAVATTAPSVPAPRLPVRSPPTVVAIDPLAGDGTTDTTHAAPATQVPAVRLGGPSARQNISSENPGERGDGRSPTTARALAARDEGVELDARLRNDPDRSQEQRIRTGTERRSPQDDRRTPNPDVDPWVSTGDGIVLLRTIAAREAPGRGETRENQRARAGAAPATTGPVPASRSGTNDLARRATLGATARLAAGVRDRNDGAPQAAAPVATQRPNIERGMASTTADQNARRPADEVDAALLAASLLRAHVNAAAQAGAARGPGEGGVGGGGAPGSGGGLLRGGDARPAGEGDGVLSLSTRDARYQRYFALLQRRLAALTEGAFPREDDLQLRQGTVILRFVIERDGTVRDVVIERRSGVPGYDANVRRALLATMLPPIPPSIAYDRLTVRWPAAYLSPVVR